MSTRHDGGHTLNPGPSANICLPNPASASSGELCWRLYEIAGMDATDLWGDDPNPGQSDFEEMPIALTLLVITYKETLLHV